MALPLSREDGQLHASPVQPHAVVGSARSGRIERKDDSALTHIEPLIERLTEQIRAQPDANLVAEGQQWAARSENLLRRASIKRSPDPLELQIDEALERVDLEGASTRLTTLLAEKQETVQVFAARSYEAGEIELLRFAPKDALPYLEQAYVLEPEDTEIATAFADSLQEQREFARAEPIYHTLLSRYQLLAQEKAAAYQPQIARTQEKLGNLYVGLQRPKEAEVAYSAGAGDLLGSGATGPAGIRARCCGNF